MAPRHVLVPLDGSPLSDRALVHALETYDCRTTVLNVVTPLDTSMSEGGILDADEDREESAEDRAETIIERGKRRAEEHGHTVETAVETGDPAETILEFAESTDVDHIVIGGHGGGRNGLVARLLGTVATTVVSEATMTVTVVRD
ncbi:universal stress protein [Haloarchaeobius sp. FL176]|uniref:universal stress protein n=1 Tax=Haloarchaeobius sp. FL176 TaxID=2967129 RepID=UPI002148DA71|nr:universal stress protein [Haloarchaeobius sp. FL176]